MRTSKIFSSIALSMIAVFAAGEMTFAQSVSTTATSTMNGGTTNSSTANSSTTMATSTIATSTVSTSTTQTTSSTSTSTSTATSTLPNAELEITNNVDHITPREGDSVTYTITVSALGPATSLGVMATDVLPSGLTLASATSSQGTFATSTGIWNVGNLSPGTNATLVITARVNSGTAGQTITNTVTVSESSAVLNTNATTTSQSSITVASTSTTGTTSTSTATSTATTTTPLSILCNPSMGASNVVTWMGSASGGTPPYNYTWSGDQVNGASGNSVTATYPATGTFSAVVQVTDRASLTATASCFVTITSIPSTVSTSTTSTSTPSSTSGNVIVSPRLMINPNGSFLGRGMTVTSVSSSSFQARIWGITYTVQWNGAFPQFFDLEDINGTSISPSFVVKVGDVVGVSGFVTPSSPFVVDADIVRDYSAPANPGPANGTSSIATILDSIRRQLENIAVQVQNLRNVIDNSNNENNNGNNNGNNVNNNGR